LETTEGRGPWGPEETCGGEKGKYGVTGGRVVAKARRWGGGERTLGGEEKKQPARKKNIQKKQKNLTPWEWKEDKG